MRRILVLVLATGINQWVGDITNAASQRNVLPLISGDHNVGDCGCYRSPVVETPHVHQLAEHSVRFSNAFTTTTLCSPSRAAISSGLYTYADVQTKQKFVAADEEDFVSLFNGRNLDGWIARRTERKGHVVEDGLLVCPADAGGYLFTEKEYADFSFRFEFCLSKAANHGIAIRCPLLDQKPAYQGMEIQILDNVGYPKELRPTQYHGSIYDVVPAKRGALKPVGEWNAQEIICRGSRVTIIVNDMVIVDYDLSQITDPELLKTHPGLRRTKGHIGLLGHNSRVEFRRLRVKKL